MARDGLADIELTEVGQDKKLISQIREHRFFLGNSGRVVGTVEAAEEWRAYVYAPITEWLAASGVPRHFPGRTLADLYVYLCDYKWIKSQNKGMDIGFPKAMADFQRLYPPRWAAGTGRGPARRTTTTAPTQGSGSPRQWTTRSGVAPWAAFPSSHPAVASDVTLAVCCQTRAPDRSHRIPASAPLSSACGRLVEEVSVSTRPSDSRGKGVGAWRHTVTVAKDEEDASGQVTVRQLGPGDRPILELLALNNAAFDVEGRSAPQRVLESAPAEAYLADPAILHWVAEQDGEVVGDLMCHVQRLSAGDQYELLLYDIGVRASHRRRGIGRRLVAAMDAWMADHGVTTVWVLADNPGAERFYSACGFQRDEPQPVAMSRTTVPTVTP